LTPEAVVVIPLRMALLVLLRHGESQWNLENRFTGWVDVPLTDKGRHEAQQAGEKLRGIRFDCAYTSVLQRATDTLDIVLQVSGQVGIPIERDQALNERHYGDLQGLNKAETAKKFGDEQVHIWRRSYDIAPPGGESLKDTAARTLPYFEGRILPALKAGKNVLVAAHGNSLRSIVMQLDQLTREQVLELNLATGVPVVYEFDPQMRIVSKRVLAG
jgi:2,3-bisphosphoglycerate-dependent phosphoglycerate mutase